MVSPKRNTTTAAALKSCCPAVVVIIVDADGDFIKGRCGALPCLLIVVLLLIRFSRFVVGGYTRGGFFFTHLIIDGHHTNGDISQSQQEFILPHSLRTTITAQRDTSEKAQNYTKLRERTELNSKQITVN